MVCGHALIYVSHIVEFERLLSLAYGDVIEMLTLYLFFKESGLNALKQAMEVCQQDLKNADQVDGSDTVDQVDGSDTTDQTDGNDTVDQIDGSDTADQTDGNDTADQTDGNDTADETDFQVVDQCSGSTRYMGSHKLLFML